MIGLLVVNLSMKFGFIMYVLLLENMIKKRVPEFGGVGV